MKIFITIISLLLFTDSFTQEFTDELAYPVFFEKWKIRKVGDKEWIEDVKFPNTIHEILFEKKIIENPYFGYNEKDLKWVEESDWEAICEFEIDEYQQNKLHFLTFRSIEPFAKVYLNGNFLFESKNSFIPYQIEVTKYAKLDSQNELKIIFESPVRRAKEMQTENKVILPGEERVFTRKPQYEFGWDWGPRFVTSGIKEPFFYQMLEKNYSNFNNIYIHTTKFSEEEAEITCEMEIYSNINQKEELEILSYGSSELIKEKINLKKGINKITRTFKIIKPNLWWPKELGDPYTYQFQFNLKYTKNNMKWASSTKWTNYAICDIKLKQIKDSIGESFYFEVNGKPIYAKGFNIIPIDHFKSMYSMDGSYYNEEKLNYIQNYFENLWNTNANMVRIWGGGVYPSDDFFVECMTNGIIVWQDFMFAGGMYPGDSSFLKNVEQEITYQVKRLRNYNNIALYCGNNEIDEAWHNWGWQKQYNYSKEDSAKIWNDYVKLFHELIPSIVKKYDPDTDYIPSSPEIGWGRKESMTQGDSHYWGVWWGKEPIETFEEKIPRFMSEFGMQAMPDLSTLRKVIPDSLMNFDSPEFKNHQKHPTGFETLNYYLEKYLTISTDMGDYAYATQLLQAITLEKAIKAQRMSEKCMGTLIWQFNDTWPVTSWSVMDSEGKKKLAYDYVQKSFADAFFHLKKDSTGYYLILFNASKHEPGQQDFEMEIKDFSNNIYFDTTVIVNIVNGNNEILFFSNDYLKKYPLDKIFLTSSSIYPEAFSLLYFEDLNKLEFLKPIDKPICKIEDYVFTKQGKRFSKHYEVTISFDQDLHYPFFIDTEYLQNNFPEILLKGKGITVKLPYTDFINEQAAIDYVKKNLKSINHLLGK